VTVIAVISDTHLPRGRRALPDACVAQLRAADLIIHAGDFSTLAVLHELQALGPPLAAVHGNVDEAALLELLPEQRELVVGPLRIGVLHDAGPGGGRLVRMRARFPTCQAVIFGHSHIPLHEGEGDFQIFNPGSPTDRRRQRQHTMGIARVSDRRIDFQHIELGPTIPSEVT
jgi:uncharacterized protein